MIQDISPRLFDNQFKPREPLSEDYFISVCDRKLLHIERGGTHTIPRLSDVQELLSLQKCDLHYLFSVDGDGFFLAPSALVVLATDDAGNLTSKGDTAKGDTVYEESLASRGENTLADADTTLAYHDARSLLALQPSWLAFAGLTALHLASWYAQHQYCGRCATALEHSTEERALTCPACGQIEYPKISPVVIVAITNGENLLLTKHAHAAYKNYALVAGFVEVGETLEEAARREIREEVGLEVKSIQYYKSQPWGLTETLLMGFFSEVEGSPEVTLHDGELSEATWFERSEIPDGANASLTWDMILAFKNHQVS